MPTNLTLAHEMNRSVSLRKPTAEIRTDQPSRLVCICCVVRQPINVTAKIRVQLKTALLSIRFALREEEGEWYVEYNRRVEQEIMEAAAVTSEASTANVNHQSTKLAWHRHSYRIDSFHESLLHTRDE